MKHAITLIAALLVLSGLLYPATRGFAQQPRQDEPVRLKTELVELDVVVTDKSNRPVTGLKREDFVLLEEGKPQTISFFSLVQPKVVATPASTTAGTPSSGTPAVTPEPGRFIFIILDQYHISQANYPRLRESLLNFVTNDLGPQDQVAIIGTGGGLAVFQQVTKNKRALALAINAFLGAGADYKSTTAIDEGLADAQRDIGMPGSMAAAFYREYIVRATLKTLQSIAKGVGDMPGRKIAIFVSEDLPIVLGGDQSGAENVAFELEDVISKSQRGGLTFYSVDPRGLVTTIPGGDASEARGASMLGGGSTREDPGASADRLLASRWGMRELAAATGGFSIFNTNDARKGLQDVLAQNDAYYLLGFYPPTEAREGKFRRLKVELKNRPGLTVRARKGYIASSGTTLADKPEPKQERITKSLNSLVPVRTVQVAIPEIAATAEPLTGERLAKLVVRIDARNWPFKEEGGNRIGSVEVIGFAYDLKNTLVDGFSKTINMKLTPDVYARVISGGINLRGEIKLKKAGLYNIRVVAINTATGDMGTASEWLEAR
ncbi:MAG TPA: VWA domain-containing protein [Blastocatellia bacterium]|nr:VWA domain-containing protein [Blastocatellia bacterium]